MIWVIFTFLKVDAFLSISVVLYVTIEKQLCFRTSCKLSKELRPDICARAAADIFSVRVQFLYGSKA